MKISSPFRILRVYAVVLVLLQSLTAVFAQAPNSLAETTLDLRVTGGTYPFASTGRYLLLFRGYSDWVSYNISGLGDSSGTYLYIRHDYDDSEIHFQDFSGADLVYDTPNTGRFGMWIQSSPAYQVGNFKAYTGTAPFNIAQKIIRVQSPSGALNFGGGGNYRILTTSADTYSVQNAEGAVVHEGTYSYERPNGASGIFRFTDSVYSGGFVVLTFETSTGGLSVVRKNGTNQLSQVGAFALLDIKLPTFTSHPVSQSVQVGTPATFSASVTGTGPFTYQWYKDNDAIGGATATSYTIPSVQLWDAGAYRMVATGAVGSKSSNSANLTPVCGYSLSTNTLYVDFRGGTQNITVFAAGTCAWTASTTHNWLTITSATAGQGNSGLSIMVEANETDTPRTGTLQIAGKTLVVVQGARFALPEIAGKTFRLSFTNRTDDLPLKEDGLLIARTSSEIQAVSFDTNIPNQTIDYTYLVPSSTSAVIRSELGDILLTYSTAVEGSFITTNLTNPADIQSGTFVMSATSPDFNDDGRMDLVLQGATGGFAAWHLQNINFLAVQFLHNGVAPNNGGRGFGAADFNGDGNTDLAVQDANGRILIWFMQGTTRIGGMALRNGVAAGPWRAFSVADVNGDGQSDILFQNNTDRRLSAWLFNGTTFAGGLAIRNGKSAAIGWRAAGAGDLNGDGQTDILLRHDSGKISAWFLNGGEFVSVEILRDGVAPLKWNVMGMGDVNEDGNLDILWQNDSNQVAAWLFDDTEFVQSIFLRNGKAAGAGWKVVAPR